LSYRTTSTVVACFPSKPRAWL